MDDTWSQLGEHVRVSLSKREKKEPELIIEMFPQHTL